MLRNKTNLELFFNAKTNQSYNEMLAAKRRYEQVVRGFVLEHVASEDEIGEAFVDALAALREAYFEDPFVEDYEVYSSLLFIRVDQIEQGEASDISEEMLTV